MTRTLQVLITAASLSLVAAMAEAQTPACQRPVVSNAEAAVDALFALRDAGCLGGLECTTDLCRAINGVLSQPVNRTSVEAALRQLLDAAKSASLPAVAAERLRREMGFALARYLDSDVTAAARWRLEEVTLFKDEPSEINGEAILERCADQADCGTRLQETSELLTIGLLFGRVLQKVNEAARNEFTAYLGRLDEQWQAYLGSARGQYPWELAVNSWRYQKTAGFDAPPTSQVIFLHPGAAYEIGDLGGDRNPSEALLLELVGFYRWSWTPENRMRQRLGGSVGLIWRDAGEQRNMGYAAVLYLPRAMSVGYVFRPQTVGDEHAVLLSADLAKFIAGTRGVREKLIGR